MAIENAWTLEFFLTLCQYVCVKFSFMHIRPHASFHHSLSLFTLDRIPSRFFRLSFGMQFAPDTSLHCNSKNPNVHNFASVLCRQFAVLPDCFFAASLQCPELRLNATLCFLLGLQRLVDVIDDVGDMNSLSCSADMLNEQIVAAKHALGSQSSYICLNESCDT